MLVEPYIFHRLIYMKIKFTIPLPPPLNQLYGHSTYTASYKKKATRDWEKEAGYLLIAQCRKTGFTRPLFKKEDKLKVTQKVFFKTDRDIDASLKSSLDLLSEPKGRSTQGVGIFPDDSQIYKLVVDKEKVTENPRMEITIDLL